MCSDRDSNPQSPEYIIIIIDLSGVGLSPLYCGRYWPIVPDPDDGDCGAIGGMKIGRGNRNSWKNLTPEQFCPPQTPHDQTRAPTRAAALGTKRLTT
jgi:hypothetical protein